MNLFDRQIAAGSPQLNCLLWRSRQPASTARAQLNMAKLWSPTPAPWHAGTALASNPCHTRLKLPQCTQPVHATENQPPNPETRGREAHLGRAGPGNQGGASPGDAFEVRQLRQQGGLVGQAPRLCQVLGLDGLVVGLRARGGGGCRGCGAAWREEAVLPALRQSGRVSGRCAVRRGVLPVDLVQTASEHCRPAAPECVGTIHNPDQHCACWGRLLVLPELSNGPSYQACSC